MSRFLGSSVLLALICRVTISSAVILSEATASRRVINTSFIVYSNSTCSGSGTNSTINGVKLLNACITKCINSSTCKSFDFTSATAKCILLQYYAKATPISKTRFCGVGIPPRRTRMPTRRPTKKRSRRPTGKPFIPSQKPTKKPTRNPSWKPSRAPSSIRTENPTLPSYPITSTGDPCIRDASGKCPICTGDCDKDSDCAGSLRCAQRSGGEDVPGCYWGLLDKSSSYDYCFMPKSLPGIVNYVGECGFENYKCGRCEGDCDSDSDCVSGLVCFQRSGTAAIPGCAGAGGARDVISKDYCVDPYDIGRTSTPTAMPTTLMPELKGGPYEYSLRYHAILNCSSTSPCDKCTGWCSYDSDCAVGLSCFIRVGNQPIPGCVTGGSGDVSDTNYCYAVPQNGPMTFIPGELTVSENGLLLSTGLTSRFIARSGMKVSYEGGGTSLDSYLIKPDFGATFNITSGNNAGGWIYLQNSETSPGGVGAITFNSNGNPVDYKMLLTSTSLNCGGGKTFWNTWITCEERGSMGQCWEVEPFGSYTQVTKLGNTGGSYESFAYDDRNRTSPKFFITNDISNGGLCRFTPSSSAVSVAETTGDYRNLLTTDGTYDWLVLSPSADGTSGTFSWTASRVLGDNNAAAYYRNGEGIEITNGTLSFTSKTYHWLFILDLDNLTYKRYSTTSGLFNDQPDQIVRIPGSNMLWFCEDASSNAGIHVRDGLGNFYSILDGVAYSTETTGLAFSPDNKRMYVSYQSSGELFEIRRLDGYGFNDASLDVRYS